MSRRVNAERYASASRSRSAATSAVRRSVAATVAVSASSAAAHVEVVDPGWRVQAQHARHDRRAAHPVRHRLDHRVAVTVDAGDPQRHRRGCRRDVGEQLLDRRDDAVRKPQFVGLAVAGIGLPRGPRALRRLQVVERGVRSDDVSERPRRVVAADRLHRLVSVLVALTHRVVPAPERSWFRHRRPPSGCSRDESVRAIGRRDRRNSPSAAPRDACAQTPGARRRPGSWCGHDGQRRQTGARVRGGGRRRRHGGSGRGVGGGPAW